MTLALVSLFNAITAQFAADAADNPPALPVPHLFGWRKPTLQPTAGQLTQRIMVVPGDPVGSAGAIGPPVKPGSAPARPLATLGELFTVYIYAADLSSAAATQSEIAQYTAARVLYDYWFRTMYNVAYSSTVDSGGRVTQQKLDWEIEKKERPLGATLRVLMLIQAAINDETMTFASAAPSGIFQTSLGAGDNTQDPTSDGDTGLIDPDPDAE